MSETSKKVKSDMSQESQGKPGGNTRTPGKYQYYVWAFTWPASSGVTPSQLSQLLKGFCKKFSFSLEKGESGYLHYQGWFSLKQKEYMLTVKNLVGNGVHLETAIDPFAVKKYCEKIETHVGGPWCEESVFIDIITELYDWQKKCEKICITCKSNRKIYWVWESQGCKGKTQFCKYMAVTHGAQILGNGAMKDLAYAIGENPKIVLINLTRDLEDRVNYSAFEAIKDGLMFSAKYESKTKIFNSPVVMIFANYEPRLEAMSADRWEIINI